MAFQTPASGSNTTPNTMLVDEQLGGLNPQQQLLNLTSEFGRLHELPPTKSMKVLTKNLVGKIDRLQKRLLKYQGLCRVADEDGYVFSSLNGNHVVVNHDEAKKLYQFRLVGIDTIRKTNLESLNKCVSAAVCEHLFKDVNDDLQDCKDKLTSASQSLVEELTGLKNAALASSLVQEEEQERMEEYWTHLIQYNKRLLEQHLLKLKGGATVSGWNNSTVLSEFF